MPMPPLRPAAAWLLLPLLSPRNCAPLALPNPSAFSRQVSADTASRSSPPLFARAPLLSSSSSDEVDGRRPAFDESAAPTPPSSPSSRAHLFAAHWEDLLDSEHHEFANELKARRARWSRRRLEASGLAIVGASAEAETELFGEKVVRVSREDGGSGSASANRFKDKFSRGDVLVLSPDDARRRGFLPRECCVVDVEQDFLTMSVGPTWPAGLWEERRRPGAYRVRLDRAAPKAPLLAQRKALQLVRKLDAGRAAAFMADTFDEMAADVDPGREASKVPNRFKNGAVTDGVSGSNSTSLDEAIQAALDSAKNSAAAIFRPNESQEEAIAWALGRSVSLIRGPPGTGKTRVAAMLISTALKLRPAPKPSSPPEGDDGSVLVPPDTTPPTRVLAVAHSNGAADVLLESLLRLGVPAIRAGRPAAVSPAARRRTVAAVSDRHPEVVALRARSRDASLPSHVRGQAAADAKRVLDEVRNAVLRAAPVVVASCIGANQLLREEGGGGGAQFPLVVLDEAAQSTEPALLCALAAARAEQVVLVGDTRQLPPTVASSEPDVRSGLGASPMARLEEVLRGAGGRRTLRTQYRMPPVLLEHPSRYFYNGLVLCAEEVGGDRPSLPPPGFPWPGGLPLAFIDVGPDLEVAHDFGGRSNPTEAVAVAAIVVNLLKGGDVEPRNVGVISPYSKQVDRIRAELALAGGRNGNDDDVHGVRVGTVDAFQGQERDVVVFSATRSNAEGQMGFLHDPRRLCVAITRARRGLILVGDERTLRNSRHWAALLDSCRRRGCCLDAAELALEPQMVGVEPER